MKRAFDLTLAGAGLVVSLPFWAFFAAAIALEDGGPVFFSQERVGLNGRVFDALKFRSMIPDAEAKTGPVQASEHDPRIARIGRLLRATAMDELPQLWNIFIGDAELRRPASAAAREVDVNGDGRLIALQDIPGYDERHRVRPG